MRYKHIILSLFIGICLYSGIQAQTNFDAQYRNARELFDLGKYELAMEEFRSLTEPSLGNPYDRYASFYYALAAYRSGSEVIARNMFSQILSRYSNWDKRDEVRYWLGYLYFEEGNYFQGLNHLNKIADTGLLEAIQDMKLSFLLEEEDEVILTGLHEQYPEDEAIAFALASLINKKPLLEKDFGLLEGIVEKFDFDAAYFNLVLADESVKKDFYNVAVLLPFQYEDMEPARGRRSNQFILDIYEGIKMATEELNAGGADIRLFAYDTKRSGPATDSILMLEEFEAMDLIIGPLFPDPIRVVSNYAFDHRVNMVNPLSSNIRVIGNSPYNFLMNPVNEYMALKAARLVADSLIENRNAIIYFEDNASDELLAATYKRAIERDSFNVVHMRRISSEDNNSVFNEIAATLDVFDLERYEQDSLLRAYDKDELSELQIYLMKPDSVGHILVASDDGLIASNIISAVNARPDTIRIVGMSRWLEYRFMDFRVAEKLGTWFIAPDYINPYDPDYRIFMNQYVRNHRVTPTDNLVLSYDLMKLLGNALGNYGTLFQYGLRNEGLIDDYLRDGYDFSVGNYNAWVPILQILNSKPVVVNDPKAEVFSENPDAEVVSDPVE